MQKNELTNLYNNISKHSNYQVLSSLITDNIEGIDVQTNSRNELIRLEYFNKHYNVCGKKVLDIGGNTGFFSFEAIKSGAKDVTYVEGNYEHYTFVTEISKMLDLNNFHTKNEYYDFENLLKEHYDLVYLLNVLHHIGDDFGNNEINILEAKKKIIQYINNMSNITDNMILQLGFNWKGNRNICLFENGTKQEMINYIYNGIKDYWLIDSIGISNGSRYEELDNQNIERNDSLGEFGNRPIFVLKRK